MAARKVVERGVIEAAGGLVWRDSPRGRELAVIHRPRYDDWALPKGWLEPGEAWAEAAVREVVEETNCQVRLADFAGCVCYTVGDVPKIVLYWHMELLEAGHYQPNDETDGLLWLTAAECQSKLSYAGERDLLKELS
jgi:ADP-ribose pyrophosphatase YjhB (NUDIX family)